MKYIIYNSLLLIICFSIRIDAGNFSKGVILLSKYIASDYFIELKKESDDLALTDTLFNKALELMDGDISEALLILTFATLPYNRFNAHIPILGIKLELQIPSVNDSIFIIKKNNLPSFLFTDSPANSFGDKDKLPHFFGNAFIAYNFNYFNLNKFIGIFVELFEVTFSVENRIDQRDIIVNKFGYIFGKALRENINYKPSSTLKLYSLINMRFKI